MQMEMTLAAYYGTKDANFSSLITDIQFKLGLSFGMDFSRYALEQVHCTIIGLEGRRSGNRILNSNYVELRRELCPMDLSEALSVVGEGSGLLPLNVRVGGFEEAAVYPFDSRGLSPFIRSFSMQGDFAVLMGWPIKDKRFPLSLNKLRRAFNSSNVLHKYHGRDDDIDNDFYFVLGRIDRNRMNEIVVQETQDEIRRFLATIDPLEIKLTREDLAVVGYTDTALPWNECRVFRLEDALGQLMEIQNLYPDLKP